MKPQNTFSKSFLFSILISMSMLGCQQEAQRQETSSVTDISVFEKEIEQRLRTYENHLKNGDSIALGNMYTISAEIIPSTVGREKITEMFGSMIRDSITNASFKTTDLWGNEQLLVEDGTGAWSHANGTVLSRGRYLLVWTKEDGQWKILRDTWFPEKTN